MPRSTSGGPSSGAFPMGNRSSSTGASGLRPSSRPRRRATWSSSSTRTSSCRSSSARPGCGPRRKWSCRRWSRCWAIAIAANPCSYDFVRYRTPYSVQQLEAALNRPDVFWAHPIPRRYRGPVAQAHPRPIPRLPHQPSPSPYPPPSQAGTSTPPPFVLTLPILSRMRKIEGWLDDEEADLLIGATVACPARALPEARGVVEVGSYCGRGTVVLGSVVKAVTPHGPRLVGRPARWQARHRRPVHHRRPVAGEAEGEHRCGRTGRRRRDRPGRGPGSSIGRSRIALLLIDGLHDYASVSSDFSHFEPWLGGRRLCGVPRLCQLLSRCRGVRQ